MSEKPYCSVKSAQTEKPASARKKEHHIGSPPTSFKNPWLSATHDQTFWNFLNARFGSERNFVPVPPRKELVQIHSPDWGQGRTGMKATWIGHASFLVETASAPNASRGIRVLFDPVFTEHTGPYGMIGPKRYSPTPCSIEELPEVDMVVISHNHYDHLDLVSLKQLETIYKGKLEIFCGLGNKSNFSGAGFESNVTELDWWDGVEVEIADIGKISLICTPAQHISGRGVFDRGKGLWCSWILKEESASENSADQSGTLRKLYFAGDTGYRYIPKGIKPEDESKLPKCPAFEEIGNIYGPIDLALLPIGLYNPRHLMSGIHCAPDEAICLHKDIRSKKSIGMHWGTVRGGLSGQYEDVRLPPRRWREVCENAGVVWGEEAGLCDIGETIVID